MSLSWVSRAHILQLRNRPHDVASIHDKDLDDVLAEYVSGNRPHQACPADTGSNQLCLVVVTDNILGAIDTELIRFTLNGMR